MSKLTAVQIRQAKPQAKSYKLPDGQGLYFHVVESGKSTWRYRFRVDGTRSLAFWGKGEYPDMSLEQARKARAEAAANSFAAVAREWMERQQERWSRSHARAVLGSLERDAFPAFGDCPADAVTPPMVLEAVRSIEERGPWKWPAKPCNE